MGDRAAPAEAVELAIRSLGDYVVLRNHDIAASLERGGDIDLLVRDHPQAEERLTAQLGPPFAVARRSYVTSLFYGWGHIDLLPALEWHGARYLETTRVIQDRQTSAHGLSRPRLAHEALVSWFSSLLWGGFFKSRYRDVVCDAAVQDGTELRTVLQRAVGPSWGARLWDCAQRGHPEESQEWARQLRRALWWRAVVRNPWVTGTGWLRFYRREVVLRLRPPLPWVAVLGPDGSGKSTLLHDLQAAWPSALGEVHLYHLRPRLLSSRREGPEIVVDPHGEPPRGAAASAAALVYVLADWWIGYWGKVVHQRAKQGLIVFDRHFLDLLVDPLRYRYGGPLWLVRALSRLVPRPDVMVVLDAPPAAVRARKQEVSAAESHRQAGEYVRLALRTRGAYLVDATAPRAEVVAFVMKLIESHVRADGEDRRT